MENVFVENLQKAVDGTIQEFTILDADRVVVLQCLMEFARFSEVLWNLNNNSTTDDINTVLPDFIAETQALYEAQQLDVYRILNYFIAQNNPE